MNTARPRDTGWCTTRCACLLPSFRWYQIILLGDRESHTWSIEPRHFQWSWTTPNPHFNVTPFFDAEYLRNGQRYGHSYYRRQIGNRTQAFEWHQFQLSSSSSSPFINLEWPLSQISRSPYIRYYSTSNNSQMVQDRAIYSYNGELIESHTWSIEPRHSQWPWRTPNPDFKVRPFFDAEYLQNDCRYGHSYYGRRIGSRTQAFKWYHFQWPSVTSNPHFKVTIVFNVK